MVAQPKVILNCRNRKTIIPALWATLQSQSIPFELEIFESETCPQRFKHIQDSETLYFFFDEDVELPSPHYLQDMVSLFSKNPELLFAGGRYLSKNHQSYLTRAYNSQIEFWISPPSQSLSYSECANIPGGAWVISGRLQDHLRDWQEPKSWAGEDTFSIRYLQQKGIKTYYASLADVYHHPHNSFSKFFRRAFLHGKARAQNSLKSDYSKMNWKLALKYWRYWPAWGLHQGLVETASFLTKIKSLRAKRTPTISPTA